MEYCELPFCSEYIYNTVSWHVEPGHMLAINWYYKHEPIKGTRDNTRNK